jgi:hypothetical protein
VTVADATARHFRANTVFSDQKVVVDTSSHDRLQEANVGVAEVDLSTARRKKPVSEQTITLVVNAHGALILLERKVSEGDPVHFANLQTGEQQPCGVVYHGPQQLEKQEIGIEFVKPSPLFWRIAFPPCPRPRLDIVSAPPQ